MANVNANLVPLLPVQQPIINRGGGEWKSTLLKIFLAFSALFLFIYTQSQSQDPNIPFRVEALHNNDLSESTWHLILAIASLFSLICVDVFIYPGNDPIILVNHRRLFKFPMV